MTQQELQQALEAISKSGITVAGDLVVEKHVEYEVSNVEAGGIGIQILNDREAPLTATEKDTKAALKQLMEARDVSEKSDVSAALRTPAAEKYWQGLRKAGFVDADCRLLPSTTRKQAMYIADVFADKLGLQAKWKLFQELWGVKNLAQEKWDCQQTGTLPSRNKDIDAIFKD